MGNLAHPREPGREVPLDLSILVKANFVPNGAIGAIFSLTDFNFLVLLGN
jgi:hypothetical protein